VARSILSLAGADAADEDRNRGPVIRLAVLPLTLLVLPLAAIVPMSFTATDVIALPPQHWGLAAYRQLLAAPGWGSALLASVEVAALAAILALLAGVPAAIGVARLSRIAAGLVGALVLIPLVLPVVVLGLAAFIAFARLRLDGSLPGIALAHSLLGVPYVFLTVRAGLARLDPAIPRAAESLGAGPMLVFRRVTLPALRPAILAGGALAFGASFEEIVIALFLSGPHAITLPVKLFNALQYDLSPVILAVATCILGAVAAGAALVVATMAGARRRRRAPARPG
jgi:ABC-type spermidine/putrescine transport system permease subunit II